MDIMDINRPRDWNAILYSAHEDIIIMPFLNYIVLAIPALR